MTDWPSVVDSAVKIGLGALIGGGFAVWTIRLNQRHDHLKSQRERRATLLQEAQLEVSRFAGLVSSYWANVRNAVYIRDKGEAVTQLMRTELKAQEQRVFEAFAELSSTRGKVLLLGEKSAVEAMSQLHETCAAFFKIAHIDNAKCTGIALDEAKDKIVAHRTVFYDRMAEAYGRRPEEL